jgi:hypothetical protein
MEAKMTIRIQPELEAELTRQAAAHGMGIDVYVTALLERAVGSPAVSQSGAQPRSAAEIRAWLDELASLSDRIPPRPGETFSREMIYQDHP